MYNSIDLPHSWDRRRMEGWFHLKKAWSRPIDDPTDGEQVRGEIVELSQVSSKASKWCTSSWDLSAT